MKWRRYISILSIQWLLALAACSGGAGREVPVVGFFQIASNVTLDPAREGYVKGLADAGFVDGQTVHIIFKNAEGDLPTAQLIARDFVSQRVDLIGTASTPALQAALNATTEIPIVFSAVSDPYVVGAGESADKHRPNVTGVICLQPLDKTIGLIREIMPNVRRVGTLYEPGDAFTELFREIGQKKSAELGFEWIEIMVTSSTDIVPGVQALKAKGVEVIMQIPSTLALTGIDGEIEQAADLGLPLFSNDPVHAQRGALAAIGWDYFQAGYEAGTLAARVLRGEKPANIPFQSATKEQFAINAEVARRLNVTIPPAVLQRADRAIGQ
jgi:putative ABC transport system substrate-binding protein